MFLIERLQPRSTRTDTLFPYPALFRSMRTIAADAMRAGAIGFSTSRTIGHKTLAGDPIPTLRAAERELTEIALGMADAGHGVLKVISDWDRSAEHTSELQSLMRISYAAFCLKTKQ